MYSPARWLVFARDHDPQAWLNLQRLGTQVRKKLGLFAVKPAKVLFFGESKFVMASSLQVLKQMTAERHTVNEITFYQ